MPKISVTSEKFDEAMALYGDEVYDHLVEVGECRHFWKLQTASGRNWNATYIYAIAYEECVNCGITQNQMNLLD